MKAQETLLTVYVVPPHGIMDSLQTQVTDQWSVPYFGEVIILIFRHPCFPQFVHNVFMLLCQVGAHANIVNRLDCDIDKMRCDGEIVRSPICEKPKSKSETSRSREWQIQHMNHEGNGSPSVLPINDVCLLYKWGSGKLRCVIGTWMCRLSLLNGQLFPRWHSYTWYDVIPISTGVPRIKIDITLRLFDTRANMCDDHWRSIHESIRSRTRQNDVMSDDPFTILREWIPNLQR